MPKYCNPETGVEVDIPESLAQAIGGYEPADKEKDATPKRRTRRRKTE